MELSVKSLVKLCEEQEWRIERTARGRFLLKAPDGEHSVILSGTCAGSDLRNARAALRQAGLVFPKTPQEEHAMASRTHLKAIPDPDPFPEPEPVEPNRGPSDTDAVLNLALEMLDALTETYKQFEQATIGTIAEFRRDIAEFRRDFQSINAKLDHIEKVGNSRTGETEMDRKPTIWEALATKLNRQPTSDEVRAEVKRIIAEGFAEALAK